MLLLMFIKGLLIGVAVAAPVGPVAILCIRRTLERGLLFGLATGMGAVVADSAIGTAAAVGVAVIAEFLSQYQDGLRIIGGLFMLGLGLSSWIGTKKPAAAEGRDVADLLRAMGSAFFLTITNPLTIFAFTGIFAAFDIVRHDMTPGATGLLIGGIALGCAVWWGGLSLLVVAVRRRMGGGYRLGWLHHVAGGLLVVFGLGTLGSLLVV